MNMESLEDDNFEEFKGGTLEINQENTSIRLSCSSNSPDSINSDLKENVLNANLNETTGTWSSSNLINIPKRLTETLWSCKNNNNLSQTQSSQAVTNFSDVTANISNDNVQDYFTFRDEVVEKAVMDCVESLIHSDKDGQLIGTFLLTEITTWDAEKERLVILNERAMYSVKYDFIALKKLEHKRVDLSTLDSIVIGDLVYPSTSLVPRLNGIASGVSNVVKGCLLDRWSQQQNSNQTNQQQRFFDTTNLFQPRDRKTHGIRIHWNGDDPIAFTQRWNPFNSDVPFITFTSHPLNRHADSLNDNQRSTFSVDEFSKQLIAAVETNLNRSDSDSDTNTNRKRNDCLIHHKDILLQTYVGLGSFIYNRNALGFFKVRGKFSF